MQGRHPVLRVVRLVLVALCAWVLPVSAWAHPDVEAGKELYQKGEFRAALAKLDDALRSPSATEEDQVEAYWYKGRCYFAMGKEKQAAKQFDEVLSLRPLYTPDKLQTPPDLREAFLKRAEAYQKKNGVTLGAPRLDGASLATTLEGNVEAAASVTVFARALGEKNYKPYDFSVVDGTAKGMLNNVQLWEQAGAKGKLEVVLEAKNARGVPVARAGDALEPLAIDVTKEQAETAAAAVKAANPQPQPELAQGGDKGQDVAAQQGGRGTTNVAEDEAAGGPSLMVGVGGAMLVGGVLLGLAALVFNGGTAALWSGVGLAYYQAAEINGIERRPDKPALDATIYWGSRAGAVMLLGIAPPVTVVGLLGLLSGLLGVIIMLVSR
ncbi:MAG: hypothetical protein AB2A00_39345 [Myxococcota bacterium]